MNGVLFLFVILSPFLNLFSRLLVVVIFSIFDILIILFSYFIIALFFRHRVLKFIDLYLNRQACKMTGKLVSFSLSVLKFVFLGDGGGGGV